MRINKHLGLFMFFWALVFVLMPQFLLAEEEVDLFVLENKKGEVIKLSEDAKRVFFRKGGFNNPKDFNTFSPDGAIWVVDTGNNRLVKISPDGQSEVAEIKNLANPNHIQVCPKGGVVWIADEGHGEVLKVSSDGKEELLRITGFNRPHDIRMILYDDSILVTDSQEGRLIKLSGEKGEILAKLEGLGYLRHMATSALDRSPWIVKSDKGLLKISPDVKKILAENIEIGKLTELAVNPVDGSCWVVATDKGIVYNIAADGKTVLLKVDGFKEPVSISNIDSCDGSFWVGDAGTGELIKVSAIGEKLSKVTGFEYPIKIILKRNRTKTR